MRVWRISPLGIELIDDGSQGGVLTKGEPVDLEVTVGGQRSYFEGLVVDLVREGDSTRQIGIRLSKRIDSDAHDDRRSDRRKSRRWICSEEFFPTCMTLTPGRFDDYVYFQIRDISATGLLLACSLRNKYLVPGLTLVLTISFPMVGSASARVKVSRVGISSEGGRDFLTVGAEFVRIDMHARHTIGQYLAQFGMSGSLDDLREMGFVPRSISKGTDFYFLKTEEDYRAILGLRLLAHQREGTISNGTSAADMGDLNDAKSRILVGKHKGEVIATGRVRFNERDVPLEQEAYVSWPKHLPPREQIVEVSRVCTHPDYRRGDLLASLMRQVAATCVRAERPYVLIVSLPNLRGLYQRIGFRDTGMSHEQAFWKGTQHLLLGNGMDILRGRGVHPLYWNYVWRDVVDYMVDNQMLELVGMDRIRVMFFRLLRPIAAFRFWWARRPRRA
jgi:predicted GNAT family N-acyltransferase